MAQRAGWWTRPGLRLGGGAALPLPIFLVLAFLHLELVLRLQTDQPFFAVGLLHLSLFAASAALLLHLVGSFFVGLARELVVTAGLAAVTVLFMSQLVYHDTFRTFYTVFSATHGGQVLEFSDDILDVAARNTGWLLLLAVPLLLLLPLLRLLRRGGTTQQRASWVQRAVVAGLVLASFGGALAGISLGDRGQNSAYDMYYREHHPVTAAHQLGLLTSMRVDLQRHLFGWEGRAAPPPAPPPAPGPGPSGTPEPGGPAPADPSAADPTAADPAATEPAGTSPPATGATPEAGHNVMDLDLETLMEQASSEELREMHRYFSLREPSTKNEHTGLFEGYNLVFITAEAYSHLAVDPVVTPTLHRLTQEGVSFTNFYTPIWAVSTSDGEYVATTGLIPKRGVWSMYQSGSNAMPFAMGNQLRDLGYRTLAFHNHTYDYYRRDVSHPNLGYDYQGVGNGLEVSETWPASDLEMIDVTSEEVLASEPFHAYYMTVSGHLQYNFGGNAMAAKNQDLVQDLPYLPAGRAYLATQIELDRALELLLERLEEAGVADRTLIVLSSDHYPYGLTHEEIEDLSGHEVDSHFELYRNSLIMYAPGMEPETVDEPVSSLDIIPSLSNLMGLEFDSRLLMGRDIFSDADPLVIFSDRSFITDRGRYNSLTREFTPAEGQEVPEGYQQEISDEIDRRFYYSTMILDHDYYDLVLDR